jgi:glucosamine--fructose-6-phosphate aminotransferase (isomerizing)
MCGIIGCIGKEDSVPIIREALKRLEYRGYDSAGIAVLENGKISISKQAGKLNVLDRELNLHPLKGRIAIGHNRWATHGEPSDKNAHPHLDCKGEIALVHNGIIENYAQLKSRLLRGGHKFKSKTDTETVVHLIEEYHKKMSLLDATRRALALVRGSYALGIISKKEPDILIGARCGSPLIIGIGDGKNYLASDIPAILGYTKDVIYLDDGEIAILNSDGFKVVNLKGDEIKKPIARIKWDIKRLEKDGYEHFMLKEIYEQPKAIGQTLIGRISKGKTDVIFDRKTRTFLDREPINKAKEEKIVIISCGTAYHAGLVAEYMLEEYVQIPVDVDLASEFRYRKPRIDSDTLVIAVTQSGETADTLAGVRLAKERGARVVSICNVMGSSIPRESDAVIYTHAGPEIAVASTKAYTGQLAVFSLLTIYLAHKKRLISKNTSLQLIRELLLIPELLEGIIKKQEDVIKECAVRFYRSKNFYYLGRRYNYPSALEGALKLKEICPVIHAEGYAAGEMKHGPISLIQKGWPVVCVVTKSDTYEKMLSNIQEIKARSGSVIAIATEGDREIKKYADFCIYVPKVRELFSPILVALPLQLLAYYIARENNCDIDQPPNLAKSVTVE